MAYVIEQSLCSACHRCRTACPKAAIRFKNAKYWIDPEKCIECGRCVKVCHNGCISNPDKPAPQPAPHDRLVKECDVCVLGGGGSGLVVSGASQPSLSAGVSISGGTPCFGGIAVTGSSVSGGSSVTLSSYTGGNAMGGGPGRR